MRAEAFCAISAFASARSCAVRTDCSSPISVTGFRAGDSRGYGGFLYSLGFHLLLERVYEDKDVQEWIVRRSKLDWVIVRPVILTDGPKTNAYPALVDPRDWTCGFISRADVADFLVKQIDDDAFLHKAPVLTSSPFYFEEQAHAAAAPPSSVMNTRRFMSDLGPSSRGGGAPAAGPLRGSDARNVLPPTLGIGRMSTGMPFVLHLFTRVRNTLPVTTFTHLPIVAA